MKEYDGREVATMSISQAVQLPGGNGLASPAFRAPLGFLGIYGWQHVEEGVEALICDGEVVTETRFASDWLTMLGRRRYLRRVLLKPAPLTNIEVTALALDHLSVTLRVSAKYTVTNPVHVASLQDPISEITENLVGCASELIRSVSLEQVLCDKGELRDALRQRFERTSSASKWCEMGSILSIAVEGDERLIEVGRKQRVEEERRGLITAKGENEVVSSEYQMQIEAERAKLKERIDEHRHELTMQEEAARYAAQNQQALLKALGDVAVAGMDPRELADVFRNASRLRAPQDSSPQDQRSLGDGRQAEADQCRVGRLQRERAALARLRDAGYIESFDLFTDEGELEGAIARLGVCDIVLTCDSSYPNTAPNVLMRFHDGSSITPGIRWVPHVRELLAEAVLDVVHLVDQEDVEQDREIGGFRFDFDDREIEGGS